MWSGNGPLNLITMNITSIHSSIHSLDAQFGVRVPIYTNSTSGWPSDDGGRRAARSARRLVRVGSELQGEEGGAHAAAGTAEHMRRHLRAGVSGR